MLIRAWSGVRTIRRDVFRRSLPPVGVSPPDVSRKFEFSHHITVKYVDGIDTVTNAQFVRAMELIWERMKIDSSIHKSKASVPVPLSK